MLLYEETKILERTIGEEAVTVFAKLFERREALDRAELATKEDLGALELRLNAKLRESELRTQMEIEKVRAEAEATKAELKRDIKEIDAKLETTKAQLQADISQLRVDVARDLREMELRLQNTLTLRMGGMMAASIAMVAALVKLL